MAPSRGYSDGAQQIRALESCKLCAGGRLSTTDLKRLFVAGSFCGGLALRHEPELRLALRASGTGSGGLIVQFPVGLTIGAGPSGWPDPRIELLRLRWGDAGLADIQPAGGSPYLDPTDHRGSIGRPHAGALTRGSCWCHDTWGPAAASASGTTRRRQRSGGAAAATAVRKDDSDSGAAGGGGGARRLSQYASTAGALLLFSVLHRDAAAALTPSLVLPGLAVAAAEATVALVERFLPPPPMPPPPMPQGAAARPSQPEHERGVEFKAARPTGHCHGFSCGPRPADRTMERVTASCSMDPKLNLAGAAAANPGYEPGVQARRTVRAAAVGAAGAAPRGWRWRRRLCRLSAGLGRVSGPAAALLERVLVPSALLSLAGRAWRAVHSSSAALAEAVADLAAVGLSYSCLARQVHEGELPPGYAREMAWRRLHKVAAQRLAHHLADLPDRPPLAPALSALQRCSIAAGLAVDGAPLCGALDALTAYGNAVNGGGCDGQRKLALSVSYCHRRSARRLATDGKGAAMPEAPATAAAPAAGARPATDAAQGGAGSGADGVRVFVAAGTAPPDSAASAAGPAAAAAAEPEATEPVVPRTNSSSSSSSGCRPVLRPRGSQPLCPRRRSPEITPADCDPPWSGATTHGTALVRKLSATLMAKPSASASSDGGVTPPITPATSEHPSDPPQFRALTSSPPPPLPQIRRQTAPGELSVVRTAAAAAATAANRGHGSSSTRADAAASASAAPLAAVRGGLPRAASASSLRSIAAPPLSLPYSGATPTLAGTTSARGAAEPGAEPSGVFQPDDAAAALVPSAASSGSRGRGTTSSPPPNPRVRPAAATGVSFGPCASNASWGSDVSCTAHRGSPYAAVAPAAVRGLTPSGREDDRPIGTSSHGYDGDGAAPAVPSPTASIWRSLLSLNPSLTSSSSSCIPPGQEYRTSGGVAGGGCSGGGSGGGCSGGGSGGGVPGCGFELPVMSPAEEAAALRREQAEAETLGLPMYGRTDHAGATDLRQQLLQDGDRPMGLLRERLGLACRAAHLLAVFAPFLTLGIALLLISAMLLRLNRSAAVSGSSVGGWRPRLAVCCRRGAWRMLLGGCRRSGAAFIKWGQWSATRVDLFPDDLCEALSELHDRAPTHSFAFTRRQVESAFGVPLDRMFEAFDPRPVASGSIAQVHRALMRRSDGVAVEVAVKVVHPGVERRIRQDFALLRPAAAALGRLPSLRSLSLPETVSQFSCSMTAQADLRVEAAHLRRFYANFSRVASQVTTPRPLPGLVRKEVMVETWEVGRSVSAFIRRPGPLNSSVVCLGVDTYLRMLLQDNFVHTDLHPGNIMVRLVGPNGRPLPPELQGPLQAAASGETPPLSASSSALAVPIDADLGGSGGGDRTADSVTAAAAAAASARVQLVLLDFGLAEELTPVVRHHFISFLHHLMRGDGAAAARHLLHWTSRRQSCPDPAALTADMVALAATRCDVHSGAGVDLDAVMKEVLRLARRHSVTIDSCYASLVIAVCVLVGFAASLDPGVNLVDAAVPALLAHALTGRVVGRLYS